MRAAVLLRQLMKSDRVFERALAISPRHSLNTLQQPQGFPLNYERRCRDSLNPCLLYARIKVPWEAKRIANRNGRF
jgi:hypothetical protein